jgi:hypothetical protein
MIQAHGLSPHTTLIHFSIDCCVIMDDPIACYDMKTQLIFQVVTYLTFTKLNLQKSLFVQYHPFFSKVIRIRDQFLGV